MPVAVGVWLLGRPSQPGNEPAAREAAVRQLLAPAGNIVWRLPEVIEQPPAAPVFINLNELPVVPPAGELPVGEDEAWEGILSQQQTALLQTAALNQPPDQNVQWIGNSVAAPIPTGVQFDGPDFSQCCGGSGGITPPDPEMAAGPDHLIVVVNLAFAIYDKSGNPLLGPLPLTSLFGGRPECSSGLFDPAAVYDEEAGRFTLTIDANGAYFCVAVAQNSDPLAGEWALYAFVANNAGLFFDYPQVGIGRDALYMSGNMFDLTTEPATYVASRLWAFDKASMYQGVDVEVVERSAGSFFTPQPLMLHGDFPADGPHYFFGMQDFENGDDYGLIAWNEPFGSNTVTYHYVNLNEYTGKPDFPVNATQAGGQSIQANDWRPLDFEYHDGYGWISQTVSCNPGNGAVDCVRWAKIRLATGAVTEGGLFASNGDHRIFPDLAVNECGDMAIGYTKSSASIYPAIWYTGRKATDQANWVQNEAELKAGELPYLTTIGTDQPPYRWGDYTGMTIDPDGRIFWYVGEYSKITASPNGRWGTYVGSFTFPDCPAVPQEFDYAIYLPMANRTTLLPDAGYWQAAPSHDFYVTADQMHVDNFGLAFNIPDCGDFKVVYPEPVAIVNNRFAFDAVIYASGVFNSPTTAAGFDGLNNLYIPACDVTITAGPFAWNGAWANDELPSAEIVTDPFIEGITPEAAGLIVIPLP